MGIGVKDIILTPAYLIFIYIVAYSVRNALYANNTIGKYFIPALTVKIIGAISTGLIYTFYYGGGDTIIYHQGCTIMWEAFLESPLVALKILFSSPNAYHPDTAEYAFRIVYYDSPTSFFVVKLASLFSFISFNTYSVIAVFFAAFSFIGVWMLYVTFVKIYPNYYKEAAIGVLFIPSVVFWGSGLLKDTVTLGGSGMVTFGAYYLFVEKKQLISSSIILLIGSLLVVKIKVYIFLCLLPPLMLWVALENQAHVKSKFLRIIIAPFMIFFTILIGYYFVQELGQEFSNYALENVTKTARSMQNWHSHVSEVREGSGYTLGVESFTTAGIIKTFPQAVNVTLFRPYLWEVGNVLMLAASLESTFFLLFTLYIFYIVGIVRFFKILARHPFLIFCFTFAIFFAFAVGFSSYNFGALSRYKIPCLPFYFCTIYLIKRIADQERLLYQQHKSVEKRDN